MEPISRKTKATSFHTYSEALGVCPYIGGEVAGLLRMLLLWDIGVLLFMDIAKDL